MKNYFTEEELSCPCCGVNGFKPATLARWNSFREHLGFPLPMTSGYRCKEYNEFHGYTQTHATGQAGDIQVSYTKAFKVMQSAPLFGFTGIGVSQKGDPKKRFIHLDDLGAAPKRPRPHIWSY